MAAIETTYGNGGVQTNTEGLPLSAGGDLNSVLAELVRRKLQRPAVQVDPEPQRMGMPMRPQVDTGIRNSPLAPQKSELERARERAELLKLKAAEQGAPMRYSGPSMGNPAMAGQLQLDDQHMNAYQRQMYLPQNAGTPERQQRTVDEEAQQRERDYDNETEMGKELLRLKAQLMALQGGR